MLKRCFDPETTVVHIALLISPAVPLKSTCSGGSGLVTSLLRKKLHNKDLVQVVRTNANGDAYDLKPNSLLIQWQESGLLQN